MSPSGHLAVEMIVHSATTTATTGWCWRTSRRRALAMPRSSLLPVGSRTLQRWQRKAPFTPGAKHQASGTPMQRRRQSGCPRALPIAYCRVLASGAAMICHLYMPSLLPWAHILGLTAVLQQRSWQQEAAARGGCSGSKARRLLLLTRARTVSMSRCQANWCSERRVCCGQRGGRVSWRGWCGCWEAVWWKWGGKREGPGDDGLLFDIYIKYAWAMSHVNVPCHIWMSNMNETCHMWMNHVAHEWDMSHMNESCYTWLSHVNVNEWFHTLMRNVAYGWGMSHVKKSRRVWTIHVE